MAGSCTQITSSTEFYGLLKKAGLRQVRFHDLRHSYASLLLQQGKSPVYVKEQLGHSSIQITVDCYGHLIPGGNRQAWIGSIPLSRGRLFMPNPQPPRKQPVTRRGYTSERAQEIKQLS